MATLHMLGLTCVRTTAEARDEPYLTAIYGDYENPERPRFSEVNITNLGRIWGPRQMDDGDSLSLDLPPRDFGAFIRVRLWEHDRVGSHEHIDTFQYTVNENFPESRRIYPNVGEVKYRLSGHRATYELIYDLRDMGDVPSTDLDRCRLILRSLRCNDAQERRDEPYIVVNGERVWSGTRVRTGQTRDLNDLEVPFGSYARIDLWESDGSRSDRFGEFTVDFADYDRHPSLVTESSLHFFYPRNLQYAAIAIKKWLINSGSSNN